MELAPRVTEAINSIKSERTTNERLLLLIDDYMNFKKKANQTFIEQKKVINAQ